MRQDGRGRRGAAATLLAATLAVGVVLFPPAARAAGGSEDGATTIKLGYSGVADAGRNPAHGFADRLKTRVAEQSEGRVSVLLFPDDQLGSPQELLRAESANLIMTIVPASVLEDLFPPARVAGLPFLVADRDAARSFYDESEFFARLREEMRLETGVQILAPVESATAVGFSSAAGMLRSPADFEDLTAFVAGGRYSSVLDAFGATVVTDAPDGGAGPIDVRVDTDEQMLAAGLHATFTHRTEAGLEYPRGYLVAPAAGIEALDPADRRALAAAIPLAVETHRASMDERRDTVRSALVGAGVSFYTPRPAEREEFRRIAQPAFIDGLDPSIEAEWITRALNGAAE